MRQGEAKSLSGQGSRLGRVGETSRAEILARMVEPFLSPRPASGRLWLDGFWLVILTALQMTVLPAVTPPAVHFDLITPWVVCAFVALPLPKAALTAAFAAVLVETHSAVPAGLYVSAYWVLCVVIHLLRSSLSWRHGLPWLITFFAAEIWIIAFESLALSTQAGWQKPTLLEALGGVARVGAAVAFGLILSRSVKKFPEEAA